MYICINIINIYVISTGCPCGVHDSELYLPIKLKVTTAAINTDITAS
jgi:hypothetical protein